MPFFLDIPKLSSSTFGGISMSSKLLPYLAGLHIMSSSNANVIVAMSGLVSALKHRRHYTILHPTSLSD